MVADETKTHENVEERDLREAALRFVVQQFEVIVVPHEHVLVVVFLCVGQRYLHNNLLHLR